MSSANNHKRHNLEKEFQRRLFDAEAKPAPDLWARIDHDLTVQENQDYKKRVLFYRQLAAACFVLFALSGSLLAYYYNNSLQDEAGLQGIATSSESGANNRTLTPEEAVRAYMEQHAEPATVAQASEPEEAAQKAGMSGSSVKPERSLTLMPSAPEAQVSGDYYNVAPGYSPYLGYGAGRASGRNRSLVSGGLPGANGFGEGESVYAPGSRYTQTITWESVTIMFGNGNSAGQQPPQQSHSFAAKPKSFVEMSEAYQSARQQPNPKSAEALGGALAMEESQKASTSAKHDSRWSLNLAYAPTVFEQNIGLPDPHSAGSPGSRYDVMSRASVNASQESYQNMAAAREEFEESTEPAFSYAVEVKAGLRLKERLKLLTGIGYSESTARTKSNYIVRQFWMKPRSNERYELSPSTIFMSSLGNGFNSDSISVARTSDSFATEYKYRHLTVPVGLQYEHNLAKEWFVYAAAGVAANFLLESSVIASNQEVQPVSYTASDQESPFRNVQVSSNISIGVGKRISPNLTLALGPEVRNYFSTLVADPENAAAPQGKPYAIGLNMSLNYQLSNTRK